MTIWNLGSINADLFYDLPRLPRPGETIACDRLTKGLGGKGANMSVAAARAGARVCHIGAVGPDGAWAMERLLEYGVDTRHIARVGAATGHALILLDADGENSIVIFAGANRALSDEMIGAPLSEADAGDLLVMQNETSHQAYAAELGSKLGLRVAYAAAPFDAAAVTQLLPFVDLLFMNEVEAAQLKEATGKWPEELGVADVIVTLGARGCRWYGPEGVEEFGAPKVTAVDTTGAGDTFTGYVLAGLDRGMEMADAIGQATRAAALMVTRHGTADVIPDLKEVRAFRA
ncbi:ribokinase [Mesobacterium pallidum]|uniref:ribokinase n=1 Tax=Mesobacterium pallidum TaxID=2872037 RepID=UPI001EE39ED7|nr:ribokinase [Mesobacterium pallidum]